MLVPERGDPTTKIGLFVGTEVRFIIFKIKDEKLCRSDPKAKEAVRAVSEFVKLPLFYVGAA
jgi:hypothetical protein